MYERCNGDTWLQNRCGSGQGRCAKAFAGISGDGLTHRPGPDGKAYEWPLYDPQERQVMVFDEFDIHTAKESEVKIVDWDRTYPLTKYFYL